MSKRRSRFFGGIMTAENPLFREHFWQHPRRRIKGLIKRKMPRRVRGLYRNFYFLLVFLGLCLLDHPPMKGELRQLTSRTIPNYPVQTKLTLIWFNSSNIKYLFRIYKKKFAALFLRFFWTIKKFTTFFLTQNTHKIWFER